MFGIINFELFLMTALLLNLTPGTDTMYIVSRTISQGRQAGVFSALGITTGTIFHTLLAAFGLSIILMNSVLLFNAIKIIGAIYLVYLGLNMIITKSLKKENRSIPTEFTKRKIFIQGMITNITNPKVALFFIAFLPQFINPGTASPIPFIILGLTFTFTAGVWCLAIAYFSSLTTKKIRNNATAGMLLNKITGIVFIAMAVSLFKTKAT
ncbi:LysE family translocator [Jeotgalibacillus soli]|uniref:Homoserine lactone transporter n=1 Tax=Jeotgalibacillus soli TaxID=889306 RepID=A0A0C2V8L1_9BACL|nr:LysE family translocator [Jeotgalibacillus soli]KIL45297.1 homoserine lactone transporter [Jeotgalibacillus soli]